MQVVDSPFSSSLPHYHSYYQFQAAGTHDHELKRQYLSLLPPKQIVEICLTFDAYVPPYAKTTVWPLDLNAAIAGLQKNASSSLSETSKSASDNTKPPEAQGACTSEPESSKIGEPPPTDNRTSTSASERLISQPSPSEKPKSQNPSSTESQGTQVASASTAQAQHAPSPNPASAAAYPQTPFGYGHVQVAYPHAPYYASGYPYPYLYPPPVQNGQTSPPAPTPFPPHPAPYGTTFPPHQPEASGNDDLPSYEEMIVEALSECTDPDGWVPKDLFTWMAARYPLQSNFRPSASQALQKAYKRGRFEKGTNGKYRLSTSWEGGSTSRRTTRRPQTQNHASSNSAGRTPAPPFTHAPLVHHHHIGHTPGQSPYPMPSYGYPGYPGYTQPPATIFNAPGTGPSTSTERCNTSTTAGDSAVAYEAAQSILKAINFGDLLKLPQDEHEPKVDIEGSCQPPHTVSSGVEHLLSHVQAVLASRNSEEAATTSSSLPVMVAETTLSVQPRLSVQVPENKRAELQAQLALLSAQLAELAQIEESRIASDQTSTVDNLPEPPMHSLTPDKSPQSLGSTNTPTTVPPTVDHESTDKSGIIAACAEDSEAESNEDDMEAVI